MSESSTYLDCDDIVEDSPENICLSTRRQMLDSSAAVALWDVSLDADKDSLSDADKTLSHSTGCGESGQENLNTLPCVLQEIIRTEVEAAGQPHYRNLRSCNKTWQTICSKGILSASVRVQALAQAFPFLNALTELHTLNVQGGTVPGLTIVSSALAPLVHSSLTHVSFTSGCTVREDGREYNSESDDEQFCRTGVLRGVEEEWEIKDFTMVVEGLGKLLHPWQHSLESLHLNNCFVAKPCVDFHPSTTSFFVRFPQLRELRLISLYSGRYNSPAFQHLNLSGCLSLQLLDCYGSRIETLDLTACDALESLFCQRNNIRELDLTVCQKLTVLDCQHNMLASLDLSVCPRIKLLQARRNSLELINLPPAAQLDMLSCSGNNQDPIISATSPMISDLDCSVATFRSLPLTAIADIQRLCLREASVQWPLAGFERLEYMFCSTHGNGSVNFSGCTSVEFTCNCWDSQILQILGKDKVHKLSLRTSNTLGLGLSGFLILQELHLYVHGQTSLDLSSCTTVRKVSIKHSSWEPPCLLSVDFAQCLLLKELICNDICTLRDFNLKSCSLLNYLSCRGSGLQVLDVSMCPQLKSLDVRGSKQLHMLCTSGSNCSLLIQSEDCGMLLVNPTNS